MFLGIDIGTSGVKTILVDDGQRILAEASSSYEALRPAPGISEQDPATWLEAVAITLHSVRQAEPRAYAAVAAIGLSGQMHSLVALGADGKPVRPAILWNDGRGREECAALLAAVPGLAATTGVMPMPGFTAAKLLWMRRHEPALFARIDKVMLAKDYVRLWLTGEIATDVSDAAGTQLLDEARRTWAPAIVAAVGLESRQLPGLVEGTDTAGHLTAARAAELGLAAGTAVAGGGGDAGTGSVGIGTVSNNQGFFSLGTGATFVVTQDSYAPRPDLYLHNFAHSIPGHWYQMAGMLNGASAVAWAMKAGRRDRLRRGARRGRAALSRAVARDVPPLSLGRAHPAQQSRCPRRPLRPRPLDRQDRHHPGGDGGRCLFAPRRLRLPRAAGCDCRRPGFIGGGARSAPCGAG